MKLQGIFSWDAISKEVKRLNEWKLMKNKWKLNIKIGIVNDVGKGIILMFEHVNYG